MAITQNNITFTNVSRVGIGSPFNNVVNGDIQNESDLKDYIEAGEEYRNIQSVLIDWNGAQLGNTIINTTGELLSYIKNTYTKANTAQSKANDAYSLADTVKTTFDAYSSALQSASSLEGRMAYVETLITTYNPMTAQQNSYAYTASKYSASLAYVQTTWINDILRRLSALEGADRDLLSQLQATNNSVAALDSRVSYYHK